ncbi:hypothetical protein [Nannocystis pusilla]|uniref:Lipoprotein n=1 Tax=Nannocystis pusilla TaxID=889268 RepID=A0ABS7TV11_9BACT|nr:hypothetical protein [Nannocystis pusilla]MBZ5711886.1 hypothetical protein [Nannocystis pusilla]
MRDRQRPTAEPREHVDIGRPVMLRRITAVAAVVLASAGAGCADTSECRVVETRTLADAEKSPQGTSASEVLGLAMAHTGAFTWDLTPDGQNPTNGDPGAMLMVAVAVERAAGEVRHVVTEQVGSTEQASACGASLYVPVRLSITTSDAALQDEFAGDLVFGAERPGVPWIRVPFAFEELRGGLRPTRAGSSGEVYAEFGAAPRGWIAVLHEARADESAGEAWSMAGHWGDVPVDG